MAAVAVATGLLAACGGGGGDAGRDPTEPQGGAGTVKVVGASLADSGAFGYRFTVQSAGGTAYPVYTERIAAAYHLGGLCPAYLMDSGGVSWTRQAGCTNHAVAGARVHYTAGALVLDAWPLSAVQQLADAGAAGFGDGDVLLVGEASTNDAAALLTAYLGSLLASTADFTTLVGTLLPGGTVGANASSPGTLGVMYMQAVADKLTAAVKAQALDKGARRVAVLNTLDVTRTPRFEAALATVAAVRGANTAAALQAMAQSWVQAYNSRLSANMAAYADRVVVVDLHGHFNAQMADPARYGLADVTATVCDQVNAQATHYLPTVQTAGQTDLNVPTVAAVCTDAWASAITPTQGGNGTGTWWQRYLFADSFHFTPYGHQLLADLVTRRLTQAGWL